MKHVKNFLLLLCAVVGMTTFVACEDNTEDMYTIRVGEMSKEYSENAILQTCVGVALGDYLLDVEGGTLRTEKEAKKWFDGACDKVKNSWTIVNTFVNIEPDTWVEMQLINSKKAVVKTKKVKFEVNKLE